MVTGYCFLFKWKLVCVPVGPSQRPNWTKARVAHWPRRCYSFSHLLRTIKNNSDDRPKSYSCRCLQCQLYCSPQLHGWRFVPEGFRSHDCLASGGLVYKCNKRVCFSFETSFHFLWWTVYSPLIGGSLSHPYENFPATFGKSELWKSYPFLLPNLVTIGILLVIFVWTSKFFNEVSNCLFIGVLSWN